MGKTVKQKAKLKALKKAQKKAAKKQDGLVLRDAENQVYRIPFNKLKKFKISGSDASKQLKKALEKGDMSTEVLSGCTDRPCSNFQKK
jgi:hypothetical protein